MNMFISSYVESEFDELFEVLERHYEELRLSLFELLRWDDDGGCVIYNQEIGDERVQIWTR